MLSDNKTFCITAAKQNGCSLQYMSNNMRDDQDVVHTAVKQNSNAFQYASENLRGDRQFMLSILPKYSRIIAWALPELQDDREIILKILGGGMGIPNAIKKFVYSSPEYIWVAIGNHNILDAKICKCREISKYVYIQHSTLNILFMLVCIIFFWRV